MMPVSQKTWTTHYSIRTQKIKPWTCPTLCRTWTVAPGQISRTSLTPSCSTYSSLSPTMNFAKSGRNGWANRSKLVYSSIRIHMNRCAFVKSGCPNDRSCNLSSHSPQLICWIDSRNVGDSSSASKFFQTIEPARVPRVKIGAALLQVKHGITAAGKFTFVMAKLALNPPIETPLNTSHLNSMNYSPDAHRRWMLLAVVEPFE